MNHICIMEKDGWVIRSTGSHYTVIFADGSVMECRLKGKFRMKDLKNTNPVVVGDKVHVVTDEKHGGGIITEIYPRLNYIIRRATKSSSPISILAANIDQALLVVTLFQPPTSTGFIDRFLLTAEAYGIPAYLIFNKIDLYSEEDLLLLHTYSEYYSKCGYGIIFSSVKTHQGLKELSELIYGKTSLLIGHSGVGKSAIIHAIEPTFNIKIGEISTYHQKGKHTTTFAQMYPLPQGGFIVDTPGIKEFGIVDFKKEEVGLFFPEMQELLHQCQYYNCTHDHEPGCAVKRAVENGDIASWRYHNYLSVIHGDEIENSYEL
ncbi:MAG TPA: ribosome small subunit-dependent GTPase A [Bacteroidales bacterium]|nr:ribosome small subunit-dependent GTPase A [Bacteroidales bacterium]